MQTTTARDPGGREWTLTRSWIAPRWRGRRLGKLDVQGLDFSPVGSDSFAGLIVGIALVLLLTVGVAVVLAVLWPLVILLVELAIVVPLVFFRSYRLTARQASGDTAIREVRGWRRARHELQTAVERIERGEAPFDETSA